MTPPPTHHTGTASLHPTPPLHTDGAYVIPPPLHVRGCYHYSISSLDHPPLPPLLLTLLPQLPSTRPPRLVATTTSFLLLTLSSHSFTRLHTPPHMQVAPYLYQYFRSFSQSFASLHTPCMPLFWWANIPQAPPCRNLFGWGFSRYARLCRQTLAPAQVSPLPSVWKHLQA